MKSEKISQLGEFGLIGQIARLTKTRPDILKGIGDDTAVIASKGNDVLLLTTDMLAEGVHFTKNMGGRAIGHKALACNISDIAAMGGAPLAAVVSIGAPPATKISFIKDLYRGMESLARRFHFSIVGGDTIANKNIVINAALLGRAQKSEIVYRSGAKKGDMIFVTAPLGRSLQTKKHLTFTPRLAESQYLLKHFRPTAMIDISDGLAGDLGHILKASKAGAVIYEKLIFKTPRATTQNALYDGEDFELLFTLHPAQGRKLILSKNLPYKFYYIGDILHKNDRLTMIDTKGNRRAIETKSFAHF